MEELQRVKCFVSREAGFIFEAKGKICQCCIRIVLLYFVNRGNLLLLMRRGCMARASYDQDDVWDETG